ncbi:chloride channel protein [Chitinophagaceae bacterium LB-8]|uniref:Chloride channel protein n=1 Tax=Paraflavisolibacter caeni TaxID=2982496 RepID=A0A9X2XUW7_9BACT|nr:chloride channel protein [Paraflavisolibacter caeni]MCU7549115.1 chloride channel protein [Paraflavisolibacter caeni]
MNQLAKEPINRIPISVSLDDNVTPQDVSPTARSDKKRLLYLSLLTILIAGFVSILAKLLVYLINLITNISFYQKLSTHASSPVSNSLSVLVILIPAIGGIIVGLMALYGSKAIRGHGIPEAMEQILVNKSKIRPSITYLKPVSAAISIGTGGPFGAEGPIIATGGALGSTIGQLLKISSYERKILLASGATAGMSAIFGSPIAAIFLAIELLLFEFSPRSIIPVALACITGAAGHHLLFEPGAVFPTPFIETPTNSALAIYSGIGLVIGILAAAITKVVYFIEDAFEKLPIHWMWWPMLGGLVVGFIGYFAPRTLGVGYENITDLLSGKTAISIVLSLCIMKFISWAIALGSGTSGGTLAPLLTIGGATGALLGTGALYLFPDSGMTITVAALVGMSAMFAGASRALLTSIVFAIETTQQANALLPLLAACVGSYLISYLLMKNTIMTEKIARRGVATPHIYEPDILNNLKVKQVQTDEAIVLDHTATANEVRAWIKEKKLHQQNYYVVADQEGNFKGVISSSDIFNLHFNDDSNIEVLIQRKRFVVRTEDNLKKAVEIMARENLDVVPVISEDDNKITGVLSYRNIISVYTQNAEEHKENVAISLKRRTLKILLHGKKKISMIKNS